MYSPGPGAPPNLIYLVLLVNLLVFLLMLPVNLLILITVFVIFLHVVIQACMCFFFEIPPFEELQDPDSSALRGELDSPTPRVFRGFLLSFFYRASFTLMNN